MKRNVISPQRSDVQSVLRKLNGMIARNGGRGWINWLLRVNWAIRGGNTAALARSAVVCMRVFHQLSRSQGRKGLVLYTKNCYVLTMQAVGGHRLHASHSLGMAVGRDRGGLPSIIPREHRRRIRQGDKTILRIWLSWFSIYRVLSYSGMLKLNTITDPGKDLSFCQVELGAAIQSFLTSVLRLKKWETTLDEPEFRPLSKSTPCLWGKGQKVSWSPKGILYGASFLMASEVYPSFERLVMYLPKGCTFAKVWKEAKAGVAPVTLPIGKLGLKQEAAGKVRVFAMVECWTQWILGPLHEFVFKKLQSLPSDGTFDQFAPVQSLIDSGKTRFWCYDLSAATDRLPVSIQAQLLNWIFGWDFGWAWAHLLVGRQYVVPQILPSGISVKGELPKTVRYAVGQPMGALSSWPLLALTHHFIVHWAAARKGFTWGSFWDYAVLGDDIIIAHGDVAGSYLTLMESLGVGIGIHKSLVSRKGVLEFAKRYYVQGQDCSPVPFKEMVAALADFESSTEFIRKYELGAKSIAGFLGLGYRVRGHLSATFDKINQKLATIGIWRASPWGPLGLNTNSWLNTMSWDIRPEWLVQDQETWPVLPPGPSEKITAQALKDQSRIDRIRSLLPTRGTYSGNKMTVDWMENGLYKAASAVTETFEEKAPWATGPCYNVLCCIQENYWAKSIPLLKNDLTTYRSVIDRFKLSVGKPLTDEKFLSWVKTRLENSSIHGPRKIGEVTSLKARPSVLFPTRLWRSLRDKEQTGPVERRSGKVEKIGN